MNILNFILELIKTIAWPITILIIVILLKKPIAELIPFFKRLKYKDLELEFERELVEIRQDIEETKKERPERIKEGDEELSSYLKYTAEVSPRGALIDAWLGLEMSALSSARMCDLIPKDITPPFHNVISALKKARIIGEKDLEIIGKLRGLRNKAVHNPDLRLTQKEVEEFIELTRDQADLISGEAFSKAGGCGH